MDQYSIPTLSPAQKAYLDRIKFYLARFESSPISSKYIFRLITEHNGVIKVGRMEVQVGIRYGDDEPIIAIFEMKDWFIIAYRSRGELVGCPKYLPAKDVVEVVEYSPSL
jgi:hypothetical protein